MTVEWLENQETKGKEIDLNALLQVNPSLRAEVEAGLRQTTTNNNRVSPTQNGVSVASSLDRISAFLYVVQC